MNGKNSLTATGVANPRLPWAPAASFDAFAALGLDADNQPDLWFGVVQDSQVKSVAAAIERNGYTACFIPLRINLPEVRGDVRPFNVAATADVELEQVSFSIVGRPRPKRLRPCEGDRLNDASGKRGER